MNNTAKTKLSRKLLSWLLVFVMALSVLPTAAFATETPPTAIESCGTNWGTDFKIVFSTDYNTWLGAVTGVKVGATEYTKVSSSFSVCQDSEFYVNIAEPGSYNDSYILIGEGAVNSIAECVITATGYSDLTLELNKTDHTATIKESTGGNSGDEGGEGGDGNTETEPQVAQTPNYTNSGGYHTLTFQDDAYAAGITEVLVNDVKSECSDYKISLSGTKHYIDNSSNQLFFASTSYYGAGELLKNNDIISIKNPAYQDLKLRVTTTDGTTLTIGRDTGEPEPEYTLRVRLAGYFEAAIVNQEGYDAISGASTNITHNKNSNVVVEAALVEGDADPAEDDWDLLHDSAVSIDGSKDKTYVTIDPSDSGMVGVYSVYDSSLTLAGTPAKAGTYQISVTVTDDQGRTATSNALTFTVYNGSETLSDQLILDNCTKTEDGKYMYDMEPWAIQWFQSANEETGTVTVPENIKAWYGSHTSGTYGELGYVISEGSETTQTLIVPEGCDLTLVNMDILSSVKIVVKNGGKLTLRDSVVQGIVEVESGGTFSMNYDSHNDEFLTGASINGQLILNDGATLDNASIYSNTNNIANGDEARHNTQPVVVVNGDVTVTGDVFIRGDEAPTGTDESTGKSYSGQPALQVNNGTLTIEDGCTLAAYGGGDYDTTSVGGSAVILNSGTVTGQGTLIAVGGDGTYDDGGNAVEGSGTISTAQAYLQGGDTFQGAAAGSAAAAGVEVSSTAAVKNNGKAYTSVADDPAILRPSLASAAPDDKTVTDIITSITNRNASEGNPDPETPVFALVNIPYEDFYKNELTGNDVKVDAVTSATKNKTRTGSLVGGSYHVKEDGTDITGITFPVCTTAAGLAALKEKKGTEIKADSSVTITVTNRGQTTSTEYKGEKALFEAPSYSYYVLSGETPACYKALTVDKNGELSFGEVVGTVQTLDDVTAKLKTESSYGDYQIDVTGLPDNIDTVYAVVLTTKDSEENEVSYGLRHLENVWRVSSLAWCTGFTEKVHNSPTAPNHYKSIMGNTITGITYYTDTGIYTFAVDAYVPVKTGAAVAVAGAKVSEGETTVTFTGLPAAFNPKYSVGGLEIEVTGETMKFTGAVPGEYTLEVSDESGVYAPLKTTFILSTTEMPAKYNGNNTAPALVAAEGYAASDLTAYLENITAVSVDGTSYSASGRGAAVIVKEGGSIALDAAANGTAIFSVGTHQVTVKATGYPDLPFTLTVSSSTTPPSPTPDSSHNSSDRDSDSGYTVSLPASVKNGKVTASPRTAEKGDTVTITVTPNSGYELDSLKVTDKNGNTVKLTGKSDTKYTFTMPASKVAVEASFAKIEERPGLSFVDVSAGAYYYDAVQWAVENGITGGTSAATFSPNSACTRAQAVTFLWRAAGSPKAVSSVNPFADIQPGVYYYDAVLWAVEQGITAGTSAATFSPEQACTRAQIVTFLYRADGTQVSGSNPFTDVADSAYYHDAVLWAGKQGVTSGISATAFSPEQVCTRAQIVTFLYRAR